MKTYRNLGELILDMASAFGDDVAFQVRRGFRMERVTFRGTGELARKIAGWLLDKGLQPGDRIVVWSPNMPEYALLYFGAWLAGLVVVPIDVRTKQDVLARFVASAGPRLGFISRAMEGSFGPPVGETYFLEDLFQLAASTDPLGHPPTVDRDALCVIDFTSGTTATPKGVMLTHNNFLAETEGMQVAFPLERSYRVLSLLPLSHVFEQAIDLLLTYSFGVRVTYVPRVNAVTIARALRDERITCFVVVPELLRMLLSGIERQAREQGQWRRWQLAHRIAPSLPLPVRRLLFRQVHQALGGHLSFIASGGAPLDLKLGEAWERMGIRIFEGYGLTEVAAAATTNNWSAARLGSVGRPLPNVDVKIADDGEILLSGPTVTPGYFDNPELTARSFADGWFRTGDIGSIDADGFVHVIGREAFKIVLPGGQKVYPEDLEQSLNRHPLMRDSCVVGISRDGGEAVHAVLLTDVPESAAEIVRDTNRLLASHQQISSWTVWKEADFPRTPTLKVNRQLVRSAVQRQQATAAGIQPPSVSEVADPLLRTLARVSMRPADEIHDQSELGADLGLDSLGLVELLAAIEEDLGCAIDELRLGPQTTVAELRRLVQEATPVEGAVLPARWPQSLWARSLRRLLLWVGFRLQDRWMRFEVVHPERAGRIPLPSILIFNYQGPYVPLAMLRALPPRIRSRVAIAASWRLWRGRDRWQGWLLALASQAFPFATTTEGAVRQSLEEMGRWLDDGYGVIISPEGGPERDEQLRPFLGGAGMMAVEMGVPVIPFRVEGYGRLFPPDPPFPYLPDKRGCFRLVIGEPISFPRAMSYEEATERARQALIDTR